MTSSTLSATASNDARLVEQSLAGDHQAFSQIVERHQSLICALAYSATGSRSRSEDLAQETFLTAWRKLHELHEPGRLRAWLCGIARNLIHGDRRRLSRQPAHAAESLDGARELASAEPLPTSQAIRNEEMAILWREVGRLPEIYREPLILFYREHRSVEIVAAALELTPDAVMQRLSRGRRQLQQRMLEFVESTLERSNPGPQFTLQVQAALPLLAGAGPAAALGSVANGGGAAAKGGTLGWLLVCVAPFVGVLAAIGVSWAEITHARSPRERRFAIRCLLVLWLSVVGFIAAMSTVATLVHSANSKPQDWTATAPFVAVWFAFTMIALTLIVIMHRGKAALRRQMIAEGSIRSSAPDTVPTARRVALAVGGLTASFWVLIFLAWQAGDRAVAALIASGVLLAGTTPAWLRRKHQRSVTEEDAGGWFLAVCGLVFALLLNWRLDVWLAPIYGVDLGTLHRLLPMAIVHWLSIVAIAWTAALAFITRPNEKS